MLPPRGERAGGAGAAPPRADESPPGGVAESSASSAAARGNLNARRPRSLPPERAAADDEEVMADEERGSAEAPERLRGRTRPLTASGDWPPAVPRVPPEIDPPPTVGDVAEVNAPPRRARAPADGDKLADRGVLLDRGSLHAGAVGELLRCEMRGRSEAVRPLAEAPEEEPRAAPGPPETEDRLKDPSEAIIPKEVEQEKRETGPQPAKLD
jgi:hypothetical protein